MLFAPNKRAPAGTELPWRGNLAGTGSWRGRSGRGGEGGAAQSRGEVGEKTILWKRMTVVLIASPRFTVLQSVQAIISFLPDNSLRAGYYSQVANGEPEAQRGGDSEGSGAGAPHCAVPLPCPLSQCRTRLLPRLISCRQGARRCRARCYGISEVSQVPRKHTNRPA